MIDTETGVVEIVGLTGVIPVSVWRTVGIQKGNVTIVGLTVAVTVVAARQRWTDTGFTFGAIVVGDAKYAGVVAIAALIARAAGDVAGVRPAVLIAV